MGGNVGVDMGAAGEVMEVSKDRNILPWPFCKASILCKAWGRGVTGVPGVSGTPRGVLDRTLSLRGVLDPLGKECTVN